MSDDTPDAVQPADDEKQPLGDDELDEVDGGANAEAIGGKGILGNPSTQLDGLTRYD